MSRGSKYYYYFSEESEPVVKGILIDQDAEGNYIFKAFGSDLSKTGKYIWTITSSGEPDVLQTTGPVLDVSEELTEKYTAANTISIVVSVDKYTSNTYTIELANSVAGIAVAGVAIAA